jgi:hypothetical protein
MQPLSPQKDSSAWLIQTVVLQKQFEQRRSSSITARYATTAKI